MTKPPVPTEHDSQVALFQWIEWNKHAYPELENCFAIPNGILKNAAAHIRLTKEGFRSGVPDFFLAYPASNFHGLFIEMKREVGGKLSREQEKWLLRLSSAGYCCRVCAGFDIAKKTIEEYLRKNIK